MSSCIKTLLSRPYPLLKPLKNPYESLLKNPNQKSLINFFSTQIPDSVSNPTKPQESLKSFNGNNGELKEEKVGFLNEIEEEEKGKDGVVSNPKIVPYGALHESINSIRLESFSDKNGELNNRRSDMEVFKKRKVGFMKGFSKGFLNMIEEEEEEKDGVVSNTKMEPLTFTEVRDARFSKSRKTRLSIIEVYMEVFKNRKVGFLNEIEEFVSNLKTETLEGFSGSLDQVMKWKSNKDLIMQLQDAAFIDHLAKKKYLSCSSKEISQDMQLLLRHWYDCGYFKKVINFVPENRVFWSWFYNKHSNKVEGAFERFVIDKKEISKCLSGSDAKSIALFGCPSTYWEDVFAAKSLRSFFKISEQSVCNKCVLNDACACHNEQARENDISTLRLDCLLRLLRAYSLQEFSPKLKLTDDMKACVSRLIREVIKLSEGINVRGIRQLQSLFPKKN